MTPSEVIAEGWLEVSDGRIAAIGSGPPPRTPDRDLGGGYLCPGFVDIHCHGGGGVSVAGADPARIVTFARAHRRHGTTTVLAGLLSASVESLAHDVPALAELVQEGIVAGIHLEGPYIAAEYRGMHERSVLRDPEPAEVDRVLRWGRGTIRMTTLAPEHPHGIDAVRRFADAGAIPAIGHTAATYDRVKEAIDAGASCMTHMFNAVRPIDHREPGPIVALSEDERVTCELILDGIHLHPAVAAFAPRAAEGRIVLITDAIAAADCGDGEYEIGVTRVRGRGRGCPPARRRGAGRVHADHGPRRQARGPGGGLPGRGRRGRGDEHPRSDARAGRPGSPGGGAARRPVPPGSGPGPAGRLGPGRPGRAVTG